MKNLKSIFYAALFAALTISCSKENEETVPAAKEAEGSYAGAMTVSVMAQEIPFSDMTFTLTATDDATADLVTPSFTYSSMALPSLTVNDLTITSSDGTCTIAQTEFSGTIDGSKSYSGTVAGTVQNDVLTLNMSLQYGSMPMAMIISFSGDRK